MFSFVHPLFHLKPDNEGKINMQFVCTTLFIDVKKKYNYTVCTVQLYVNLSKRLMVISWMKMTQPQRNQVAPEMQKISMQQNNTKLIVCLICWMVGWHSVYTPKHTQDMPTFAINTKVANPCNKPLE